MDTQGSSLVDVPNLKLAKVGNDREKRRGGAGWWGARGAGAGFSGATGGGGMSVAKILAILLLSGGVSAGAWQLGNMLAANSAAAGKPAPKVFADKDLKYADTSGVIKPDSSIPNSLGYVNNDGLTDDQRAAKKAADDAAARKAAEDAQKQADADAKKKAAEDAQAASAEPAAAAATPEVPKKGLAGGKFGGMTSGFGGGSALTGGAGLSGGINRNFGAMQNLGAKGQSGTLAAFRTPTKVASTRTAALVRPSSKSKGFAKQQLDMANGMSRTALAAGKTETAATGAAAPFDNNPNQGTVISGPGVANGVQSGPADNGATPNQSNTGGPLTNGAACASGQAPDSNGNCQNISSPTGQNAAPYQGLINAVLIMMGIVAILSVICMVWGKTAWLAAAATYIQGIIAALGLAIAGMGVAIAGMQGGDFMIGAIIGAVGAFITAQAAILLFTSASPLIGSAGNVASIAAPDLIATAVGMLAAASTESPSMM